MPKPRAAQTTDLARRLLLWRPDAFAHIAKHLDPPTSRQHVAYVAHGVRQSKRIEKALRMAIARRRYP